MSERREDADKTQSLKHYEAEPEVCASETDDGLGRIDYYSPFGPLIARLKLPEALIGRLNGHIDGVVAEYEAQRGPDDGPLGTFRLTEEAARAGGADSLSGVTARYIANYVLKTALQPVEQIRFELFWVVRHFAGSFGPAHFHSGDVSGVMYLKMPDRIANLEEQEKLTYVSNRRAGYINFLIGGAQKYSKSLISFKPEVGDFYIFPGWLLHAAEPFEGDGERRSLAFNAHVS